MATTNRSTPTLPAEVQAALDRGDFMGAVKLLRESGGIDLAEAKQAIDRWRRKSEPAPAAKPRHARGDAAPPRIEDPAEPMRAGSLAPGEVPRSSNRLLMVVVVAALLYLLWRVVRATG